MSIIYLFIFLDGSKVVIVKMFFFLKKKKNFENKILVLTERSYIFFQWMACKINLPSDLESWGGCDWLDYLRIHLKPTKE